MLPSGPSVMLNGRLSTVGVVNSVITPSVVIRPIFSPGFAAVPRSVNQSVSRRPGSITVGRLPGVGTVNSVISPSVVMRPILLPSTSANQRLSSGPVAMPSGPLLGVGIENSVICPSSIIRLILLPLNSVNQRLPSGPTVIPIGPEFGVGTANSWIEAPGAHLLAGAASTGAGPTAVAEANADATRAPPASHLNFRNISSTPFPSYKRRCSRSPSGSRP
jgi:hypothetical protein